MATQGVTLDKVSIEIQSSSSQASQDIDRLTTSLTALRGAIKGGFNGLNKLALSLNELATSSKQMSDISTNISKLENVTLTLQELSNIPTPTGFKAIVKGLNDLKIASDNLGDTDAKLSGIPKISEDLATLGNIPRSNSINSITKNLERLIEISPQLEKVSNDLKTLPSMVAPLSSLQSISVGKGLSSVVNNLERIPEAMQKFDSSTLENVARVSTQLASALTPVADKFRDISAGAGSLSEMANKYGIGITKIREQAKSTVPILNRFKKSLIDVSKNILNLGKGALTSIGGHAVRSFQKAASKAKQLTLALIGTRTIFTLTRKAVSEYLALDQELSKFSTNIWRALGAQLAPAIEYVMGLFKQFVRVIYSFVYAITGIDLIARANAKAMAGWSKSAKDALGNLQKFDDLNVVEFPKPSGEGPDLIDMDKIDLTPIQWLVDLIKELKQAIEDAFDTGEWKGVGTVIAKIINTAFDKINVDKLRQKLFDVADDFGDAINGFFEEIDFYSIMQKLSDVIITVMQSVDKFIKRINWKRVGQAISDGLTGIKLENIIEEAMNIMDSVVKGFEDAFLEIDWNKIAENIEKAILKVLKKLQKTISETDWNAIGDKIGESIRRVNWLQIFTEIVNTFQTVISSSGEFLDGFFGTTMFGDLANSINNIIDSIGILGNTIVTSLGEGSAAGDAIGLLETICKSISDVTGKIKTKISEWVVSPEFQSSLDTVNGILSDIFKWADDIIKDWTDWYNKEGSDDFKEVLDTLTRIASKVLPEVRKLLNIILPILSFIFKNIILPHISTTVTKLEKALEVLEAIIDFLNLTATPDIIKFVTGVITGNKQKIVEAINDIRRKINNLIDDINRIFNKKIIKVHLDYLPTDNDGGGGFRGYATGGYPEKGQYFYARENGIPEMVGSIGSQTAVANNMQIVQGIKQGVKEAIQEADFNFTNVVNVGNETLYKKQQAYNKLQNNKYGTINV